LVEHYWY